MFGDCPIIFLHLCRLLPVGNGNIAASRYFPNRQSSDCQQALGSRVAHHQVPSEANRVFDI